MLVHTDPFRELDRFADQLPGSAVASSAAPVGGACLPSRLYARRPKAVRSASAGGPRVPSSCLVGGLVTGRSGKDGVVSSGRLWDVWAIGRYERSSSMPVL